MIIITGLELAQFTVVNNWLLVTKSDEGNYLRYLTPYGNLVSVRFGDDGRVKEIREVESTEVWPGE